MDNLFNADKRNPNDNTTIEEVLQALEQDFEKEFSSTRVVAIHFEPIADAVFSIDKETQVKSLNLKKIKGDVYLDEEEGVLCIIQGVINVDDNLFLSDYGDIFKLGDKDEEYVTFPKNIIQGGD